VRNEKITQAHQLLNAMGEIDDRYLDEALTFSAKAKKRRVVFNTHAMRAVSGVAALAAVLSLVVFGATRGFLKFQDKQSPSEESVNEITPSLQTLNSLLQFCAESDSFTPLSADGLSPFDGTVRLIVQSPDSEALYVSRPLSVAEQAHIRLEFEQTGKQIENTESSDTDWAIWVSLGDGQILTPCLSPTPGNMGMGELFAYQSERLPSQAFFNLLNALI
jgi:hypothetical protein